MDALDPTRPHLAHLDTMTVLEVRGDDRKRWLQGQITQDVHHAEPGQTIHGFHLDSHGKILAELRIVEHQDAYLGIVDRSVAEGLARDLDRRIVMEDVEIRVRPDLRVIGIYGGHAAAIAGQLGIQPLVSSSRFGHAGIEAIVASADLSAVFMRAEAAVTAEGGEVVSVEALDRARILAGMPRFLVDFGTTTLPQETGMHRRTVSFVKGCYVGQEPVVMIEHRGKPPRRMCVVAVDGGTHEVPFEVSRADGGVAGRCTSLAEGPAGWVGIALLKRADAENDQALVAGDARVRIVRLVALEPA